VVVVAVAHEILEVELVPLAVLKGKEITVGLALQHLTEAEVVAVEATEDLVDQVVLVLLLLDMLEHNVERAVLLHQ
jgi:hypothetical protein